MRLSALFEKEPKLRSLVLSAMAAVGRGGQSDVGQRIRDDILVIQRKNNCMVGARPPCAVLWSRGSGLIVVAV